jgi:phosphoribosylaminoimidazolecarboxamide formyltransferase/IMP cyclohydrolase
MKNWAFKEGYMKIKRAVISVSNKSGLQELASFLKNYSVEILSTGGTKKYLDGIGVNPTEVSAYTGFPEIMDGRVKTLHPKVHGGILNIRDNKEHQKAMESLNIKHIDMIVVNLYPFKEVISKGCTFEEAIENIDIGGPSMVRAAAKNFKYVTVVIDPDDYSRVMENMKANNGETTEDLRFYLAKKVFYSTSEYDSNIYKYLSKIKR